MGWKIDAILLYYHNHGGLVLMTPREQIVSSMCGLSEMFQFRSEREVLDTCLHEDVIGGW